MITISDKQFQDLINQALAGMPKDRMEYVKNVAFLFEEEPTPEQREKLQLRGDQTLLGLYEGVPLTQRQGMHAQLPDRITLFKLPLCMHANDIAELKEEIRHTLWHEIAHYYGLDHGAIHRLEQ